MAPIFFSLDTVVFDYGPFTSILICLFLAVSYVGSLYVWTSGSQVMLRDHPSTIKRRFIRVAIVCTLVIPFLWMCSSKSHNVKARNLFVWIGLRFQGFVFASFIPLLLTMILFLGPLYLHYLDGIFKIYKESKYWLNNMRNLIWLRNHVVAPVAEEFIFRGCLLPFLVPNFGEDMAVKICPLFFSIAHFHHFYEKIKMGADIKQAMIESLFQFSYTTVFGAYSAFLFLRTDHLIAPVLAHAFCNHMGFPNFRDVLLHPMPQRAYIMAAFVGGLVIWLLLLNPLTEPWLYANDLYYV